MTVGALTVMTKLICSIHMTWQSRVMAVLWIGQMELVAVTKEGHISEGLDWTGTSGRKFRLDDVRDVRPLPPGVDQLPIPIPRKLLAHQISSKSVSKILPSEVGPVFGSGLGSVIGPVSVRRFVRPDLPVRSGPASGRTREGEVRWSGRTSFLGVRSFPKINTSSNKELLNLPVIT